MGGGFRLLRVAAALETLTLLVLLANVLTAHDASVSAITGPAHGCSYLLVCALAVLETALPTEVRLRALVPGVGGYLVLRGAASRGRPR